MTAPQQAGTRAAGTRLEFTLQERVETGRVEPPSLYVEGGDEVAQRIPVDYLDGGSPHRRHRTQHGRPQAPR
eukprot:13559302-Alexandrium_andersonii.AAC.1